jgi:hypothetical protein
VILAELQKGEAFITERQKINIPYQTASFPVELLSLSEQNGVRCATISEFGPVLFSRILNLNDTQAGVIAVIFKYCDDNKMPLLDLKTSKVINFITEEGKEEIEENCKFRPRQLELF